MRRQNNGGARRVDLAQKIVHRAPHFDIDSGRGLVEDQYAGLMNQRARDHQPPLHPSRQHSGSGMTLIGQAQFCQVSIDALAGDLEGDPVIPRLVYQDIFNALEDIEVELLRHDAQVTLGTRKILVDIHAVHPHRTRSLVDE